MSTGTPFVFSWYYRRGYEPNKTPPRGAGRKASWQHAKLARAHAPSNPPPRSGHTSECVRCAARRAHCTQTTQQTDAAGAAHGNGAGAGVLHSAGAAASWDAAALRASAASTSIAFICAS